MNANRFWLSLGLALCGICLLLAIWVGGAWYVRRSRADIAPAVIAKLYPEPQQVLAAAKDLPMSVVASNVLKSSLRVLMGFLAAAMVAVPAGLAIGRIDFFARMFEPLNDFLRYLPVAGFSSLTILLAGAGDASAVVVVFVGTVFHLVVATTDAVRRVPQAYLDLGRTLHYGSGKQLVRIVIPASAPAVFDNLRIALGWAWSYVTLAEVMGVTGGLGFAIETSRRYLRTDQVLLWIILVGLLGLTSDQIMRFLSRRWFTWKP